MQLKPNKMLVAFVADVHDDNGDKIDELTLTMPEGQPFACFPTSDGNYRVAGSTNETLPELHQRVLAEAEQQINAQAAEAAMRTDAAVIQAAATPPAPNRAARRRKTAA